MNSIWSALIVIAVVAVGVGSYAEAQVVALVGKGEGERPKTFTPTEDGNWRTMFMGADGVEHEYVYVPGTKVKPQAEVALTLASSHSTPTVTYRYTIRNGQDARQPLARFFLGTVQRVSVRDVPNMWEYHAPQSPGAVIFSGRLMGDVPMGILPGEMTDGLVVEGPILPGVVTARTMGNIRLSGGVPPELTEEQRDDLLLLSRPGFVDIPVIGPAIGIGVGEPELGFDILLSRISNHYVPALRQASHPDAPVVAEIFAAIVKDGVAISDNEVREGLERILSLRPDRFTDPWHRQLSEALAVCVRALLGGNLPIQA